MLNQPKLDSTEMKRGDKPEISCRYCGSQAVVKYGAYKGVQRYWCKVCKRKFKADDMMYRMKTPTNQVSSALNLYYGGSSIKKIGQWLQQEYGHTPSTATIYEWIQKYTQYAIDSIRNYHPEVGDTWIADETVITLDGQQNWLWDIIDVKTRFLLASRISRSRTTQDAQMLIDRAIKTAGKPPKLVFTDKLASYLDVSYGKDAEHRQGSPFASESNTSLIERFHGTLKDRTKVMRGLKNTESAIEFTDGWIANYNYLRPHKALGNKTPAEVAGIAYPYEDWADIIRKHTPTRKIIIEHQPRTSISLPKVHIGRPRKWRKPAPTSISAIRSTR